MLNLIIALAALIGLPALSQVGRLLMSLFARLLTMAFVMAFAIIVLVAVATHGKVA